MGKDARLKKARREADRLPPWTPLERGTFDTPQARAQVAAQAQYLHEKFNMTLEEAAAAINQTLSKENYLNSRYQVNVMRYPNPAPGWPDVVHLSIKRRDKEPVGVEHFRDFQRIKNELVGPECEAVEIYPAESQLVDTSNQYHLWVLADPTFELPFGMRGSRVVARPEDGMPGSKQRPFEED